MSAPLPEGRRDLDPRSEAGVTAECGARAVPLSASDDGASVLHTSPPCKAFSTGDPLTGAEREHICHVLRLFVTLRASALGLDLADAPKPVKAVHAGRGARLNERDLWLVGAWVGVTPDDLRRAARRACGRVAG